ncbi:MAG: hypothetical protein COW04_10355, partial [Deltaproteobacteria bacterium CG12_big_fil_rev_8_21_14_0_65_43_10]
MRNTQEKFDTIITKNTFYFYNQEFEEIYEGYVNSIKHRFSQSFNRHFGIRFCCLCHWNFNFS